MNIFTKPNEQVACAYLLEIETVELSLLLAATAASLLAALQHLPVVDDVDPSSGAPGILCSSVNWASHGYVNAFLRQADLLYTCLPALPFTMDRSVRLLIVEALTKWQRYKVQLCAESERVNGPGFGSGTGFYKMDWTDRNHLAGV